MEILLIRHGQPNWAPDNRSRNDPVLSDLGRDQAERLARSLEPGSFDLLWVSPLKRAEQTAEPIAEALDLEPETHDFLAEITNPAGWDGSPVEEVERILAQSKLRPPEEMWEGFPEGESFREFHQRVTQGMTEVLSRQGVEPLNGHDQLWTDVPQLRVMVVAHGGTNAVLLGHLLGLEPTPWEWDRFDSAHTSHAQLKAKPVSVGCAFGLLRFGDTTHLPPELVTR